VSQASSSSGSIAIITAKTNPSDQLWELDPSAWGVASGSGSSTMSYSGAGSITTTVKFSGLNSTAVNGCPFIFYGGDEWGDQIGGQPPQFPAQLSAMSSLIMDVDYSLSLTQAPGNLDIADDEWLIPTAGYTGGNGGALEVFVAWYFNFAYGPAGSFVKVFTEPVTLNGTVTSMKFDEYSTGTGAGNFIAFYPESNITSGEIRYNLLDFLNEAAITGGLNSNWWLAGIEFGTEFGDASSVNYSLTVTKLQIAQSNH
jgi:Glycosyl hydrolase family 12